MRDLNARSENLTSVNATAFTHVSFIDPDIHVLRIEGTAIEGTAIEITITGPTRGEAMVELAETLQALVFELRQMAFEQEGTVRIRDFTRPAGNR